MLSRVGKEVLIKAITNLFLHIPWGCFNYPRSYVKNLIKCVQDFGGGGRGEEENSWEELE